MDVLRVLSFCCIVLSCKTEAPTFVQVLIRPLEPPFLYDNESALNVTILGKDEVNFLLSKQWGDIKGENLDAKETVNGNKRLFWYKDEKRVAFLRVTKGQQENDDYVYLEGLFQHRGEQYYLRPAEKEDCPKISTDFPATCHLMIPQGTPPRSDEERHLLVNEDSEQTQTRHSRSKRSTRYVLEVYGIMEFFAFMEWSQIAVDIVSTDVETFIRYLYQLHAESVNRRFATLGTGSFSIDVVWKGLYIADNHTKSPWVATIPGVDSDGDQLLNVTGSNLGLNYWLWDKIQEGIVPVADHYLIITGFKPGLNGDPHTLCTENAITYVQETLFDNIIEAFMTRSLARSLGAEYDGRGSSLCADNNFIMSPDLRATDGAGASNPWKFSSCTAHEIRTHLESTNSSCLGDQSNGTDPIHEIIKPGYIYDGDDQCRVITGWADSYVCRPYYNMTYRNVCVSLWCAEQSGGCSLHIPAEGTACGNIQWCMDHSCVIADVYSGNPDSCVFGEYLGNLTSLESCEYSTMLDSSFCYLHTFELQCCISCPGVRTDIPDCAYGNRGDCNTLKNWECYNTERRRECCQSCHDIRTSVHDCQFGDKTNCTEIERHECYDPETRANCCYTCPTYGTYITGCEYGDREPADCGSVIGEDCYNTSVSHKCCQTCNAYRTNIEGCQYGDRDAEACVALRSYDCYVNNNAHVCCKKCANFSTGNPQCPYGDRIKNCSRSNCRSYSLFRQQQCCDTCSDYLITTLPTTSSSDTTTAANVGRTTPAPPTTTVGLSPHSGQNQGWVVPLAAGLGGVVVTLIAVIIVIFVCIKRRKFRPRESIIDDKMYNEYKQYKMSSLLKDRAPVPEPRTSVNGPRPLVRQDTGTYAYINPADVESIPRNNPTEKTTEKADPEKRREGNDPLPPTPGEYVDFKEPDKYGYIEPVARTENKGQETVYLDAEKRYVNMNLGDSSGNKNVDPLKSTYQKLDKDGDNHAYNLINADLKKF